MRIITMSSPLTWYAPCLLLQMCIGRHFVLSKRLRGQEDGSDSDGSLPPHDGEISPTFSTLELQRGTSTATSEALERRRAFLDNTSNPSSGGTVLKQGKGLEQAERLRLVREQRRAELQAERSSSR